MASPFLGEIRAFSFTYAPRHWATCDGQLLAIATNTALFSLLGTTYGGNGTTNFALPNLKGRTPVHTGSGYSLGQVGGAVTHTLNTSEIPAHFHTPQGTTNTADQRGGTGNTWASSDQLPYAAGATTVALHPGALAVAGGNQAHNNEQPYLTLLFCIAMTGVFPSRS